MITIAHRMRRIGSRYYQCQAGCLALPQRTGIWRWSQAAMRMTLTVLVLLTLASCTNSKLLIAPLYNRLDDQIRGEFHKLAKWNDEQIAHFESRVGTYHVWHRQQELPKYAALLDTIQASIGKRGKTEAEDVRNWVDEAEMFSRNARLCHPVNFSFDLMQTLTDEQVNFIERRFARERKRNFSKYLKATPEERREERLNNVVKWAGRIGFEFNDTQKRMLDKALTEQISLRRQYYARVDDWARDLFIIARKQDAPDYEVNMRNQVNKLWTLMEDGHQAEWQANREMWRDFGYRFIKSLSYDQRIHTSNWLEKMGKTIQAISKDKPSFKLVNEPKYGCLVG